MLLLFNSRKNFLKCKLPIFAEIKSKGSNFTLYYLPINRNKMKIFNLVYKIKKAKTEKSCAVDRLYIAYI